MAAPLSFKCANLCVVSLQPIVTLDSYNYEKSKRQCTLRIQYS